MNDFRLEGVRCPPRVCRLIAPTLIRDLRAALREYGKVDAELAAWVRAVDMEGDRYAACENAKTDEAVDWTSFVDANTDTAPADSSAQSGDDLLTAADAAHELGCSASNVRYLVANDRLSAARKHPYMFARAELERHKSRRKSA